MSKPRLAWFRTNRRGFRLEVVSFGLNLMDGTFEFGVLLVVTDPSYWEEFADGISLDGGDWVDLPIPGNTCTRGDVLGSGASYPSITVTVSAASNAPSSVTNMATASGGGSVNATAMDVTSIAASAVDIRPSSPAKAP
jgi:hypothetical protein